MSRHVVRKVGGAVSLNAVAFGLVIATQQLMVFPALSRIVGDQLFARTILCVTVATIAVNVVGGESSNVALLRSRIYRQQRLPWDFPRLLVAGLGLTSVVLAVLAIIGVVSSVVAVEIGLLVVLGSLRTYGVSPAKSKGRFGFVVVVHATYATGAIGGLLLVDPTGSTFAPFLLGELLANLALLPVWFGRGPIRQTIHSTSEFRATAIAFGHLACVAALMNFVSYADRLIIVPMLGSTALSLYYAASALSKSLSLITNPAANAALAYLGRTKDESASRVFRLALRAAPVLLVVFTGTSLAITYVALKFLYPMYFEQALTIIVPVAIAAGASSSAYLLQPIVMRFANTRRLLTFNLAYAAAFLVLMAALSKAWGLLGFAWAGALASTFLLILYVGQAYVSSRVRASEGIEHDSTGGILSADEQSKGDSVPWIS